MTDVPGDMKVAVANGDLVKVHELWNDEHINDYAALLHTACHYGHLHVAKWLVDEKGCNIEDKEERIHGQTPLMRACWAGSIEIVRWLIFDKHANVHELDRCGRTALFYACIYRRSNYNPVQWLLNETNINIHVKDESGLTALCYVCHRRGACENVQLLLMRGATVKELSEDTRKAVHGRMEGSRALLEETIQQRSNLEYLKGHIAQYPSILADAPPKLQQDHGLLLLALGSSIGDRTIDNDNNNNNRSWCQYRNSITYYLQEEHYDCQHDHIGKFYSTIIEQLESHNVFVSVFLCGVHHRNRRTLKSEATTEPEDSRTNSLPTLNQGKETSQGILELIAEYAAIPKGVYLQRLRNAHKNIKQHAPAAVMDMVN